MNPIVFALRRPLTVMVALVAVALSCGVALRPKSCDTWLAQYGIELPLKRMAVDIFPALNLPVIYVGQPYGGMDPAQMEGPLTNYYEYHFLYIGNIHHVESRNVQRMALIKLTFHSGTNMAQAMAEIINYVNRSRDDATRNCSALRHAVRRGERPRRVSRAVECHSHRERDHRSGALRLGMCVSAELKAAVRENVLSLPTAALLTADKVTFCHVIDTTGKFSRVRVQLGIQGGTDIEVHSGQTG